VTVPDIEIMLPSADFEPWRQWSQAWFGRR
jgi:hypothetical protein